MQEEPKDQGQKPKAGPHPVTWVGAGLAVGAGVGVAMDNIALGVGLGLFVGALISLIYSARNKKKSG